MIIFLLLLFIITYLLITGRAASGNCKAAETYNRYSETQRTATSFEIQMKEKEAKFTLWAKEQYAELISWSAYMDNIPAYRIGNKYEGEYLVTFVLPSGQMRRYITIENGTPRFGTIDGSVSAKTMAKEWLSEKVSFFQKLAEESAGKDGNISVSRSLFSPEKDVFDEEISFLLNSANMKISVLY